MCLSTSCIHLVSYVGFPPLASPQLLAFMLFQYPNFSCTPVPLSNFLHAFGFNISASPISQQLLALIWFQYLTSPLCLSSNFLNFLHSLGFNIYTLQGVQRPSPWTHWVSHLLPILSSFSQFLLFTPLCPTWGIHLASISKLPPLVPLSNFLHSFTWSQDFPSGLFFLHAFQPGFNV